MSVSQNIGWLVGMLIGLAVVLYTNPHPLACLLLGFGMGSAGILYGGLFNTSQSQGEATE
jgi:hypothetical protein